MSRISVRIVLVLLALFWNPCLCLETFGYANMSSNGRDLNMVDHGMDNNTANIVDAIPSLPSDAKAASPPTTFATQQLSGGYLRGTTRHLKHSITFDIPDDWEDLIDWAVLAVLVWILFCLVCCLWRCVCGCCRGGPPRPGYTTIGSSYPDDRPPPYNPEYRNVGPRYNSYYYPPPPPRQRSMPSTSCRDLLCAACLFECCCRDNQDIDCCEICCCVCVYELCCRGET